MRDSSARSGVASMSEAELMDAVRLALGSAVDLVLWRNNVGVAEHWNGTEVQRVRYGLAAGSSDLVGVLAPQGRWFALELKTASGRVSPEQSQWLALVRLMGGFACVVRSVDEAKAALVRARGGARE